MKNKGKPAKGLSSILKNLWFALPIFWAACSPKVDVELLKAYQPDKYGGRMNAGEVTVYEIQKTCPKKAEVLAKIFVGESGSTAGCGYDEILQLAKENCAKIGANTLCIDRHQEPGISSSCHQIWGRMAYTGGTVEGEEAREEVSETPEQPKKPKTVNVKIHLISGKQNHRLKELPIFLNGDTVAQITSPGHELIVYQGNPEINIWVGASGQKKHLTAKDGKDYYLSLMAFDMSYTASATMLESIPSARGRDLIDSINKFWITHPLRRKEPPKVAFGGYYGVSLKLGKIEESKISAVETEIYKGFRWGGSISANLDYYFGRNNGIGFHYNGMEASESVADVIVTYEDSSKTPLWGTLSGRQIIDSYGASYVSRLYTLNGRFNIAYSIGFSYVKYQEKLRLGSTMLSRLESSSIGFNLAVRADYFIERWLALGLQVNYHASNFTKIDYEDQDGKRTIDLAKQETAISGSFFSFGGGLRAYF